MTTLGCQFECAKPYHKWVVLLYAKLPKMEGIGFSKNGYFWFLPKLVNLILIA